MDSRSGRGTYFAILGLAMLLLASSQSYWVLLPCKFFCDSLVVGQSAGKTLLFLAWLLLVALLRPLSLPYRDWMKNWSLALLAVSYAMAVAEHIRYCMKVGIAPWDRWSALTLEGAYSYNTPGHLHASKSQMSWLLQYNGGDVIDAGYPFLALFPGWWLSLHLAISLAAFLLILPVVREQARKLEGGHFASFVIAAFCLLKSAVDGGPLSQPVLLALVPALYFLSGKRAALVATPLVLAGLLLRLIWHNDIITYEILHGLSVATFLYTPLLFESLRRRKPRAAYFTLLSGVCILVLSPLAEFRWVPWARWQSRAVTLYHYGTAPLPTDSRFTIISPYELAPDYPDFTTQERYRGHKLRLYEARAKSATSPLRVCQQTGVNLLRFPVAWKPFKVYFRVYGVLFDDWPEDWPSSELVSSYRAKIGERAVLLEIELRPGSNLNVLKDSLPRGLMLHLAEPVPSYQPNPGSDWLESGSHRPLPRGQLNE